MRYELTDYEWAAIKPMLPNTPRGVPRLNDRRALNLPRRDPHDMDRVADHVGGALLAFWGLGALRYL